MLISEIISIIEAMAPLRYAYSWDNSGFLCGDINRDVNRVYLTLDVNRYTVEEAAAVGAEFIISHHPIMFGGIKNINYGTNEGFIISELIKNDIALYASHTPMDTARGGINDILAEKLGITDTDIIERHIPGEDCGLGRIGRLEKTLTFREFAQIVKEKLNTPFVRISGDPERIVNCAAVGSGACSDIIPAAHAMGADVMVTADMKYHIAMDNDESGICVIDAGHYPTEVFVIDIFEKLLKNTGVELIKSTEKDVFDFI